MRLLNRRSRAPAPPFVPLHPRHAAVELLREKIAAGQAGIDPYDETVFILQARDTEQVWAHRALELCGLVIDHTSDGRFRAILEADVRAELGLDTAGRALMLDEPIASRAVSASEGEPGAVLREVRPLASTASSRGVAPTEAGASPSDSSHAGRLMDATLRALEPEPVSLAAIREAKAAYDRRST